jgi:hypothetical protein
MKRAINFLATLMFAFVLTFGFVVNTASADRAMEVATDPPTVPNLLVTNARIIEVQNTTGTSWNDNTYVIRVSGGTSKYCSDGRISFPVTGVNDISSYERGFQMALEALNKDLNVDIAAFQSTNRSPCNNGGLITISK